MGRNATAHTAPESSHLLAFHAKWRAMIIQHVLADENSFRCHLSMYRNVLTQASMQHNGNSPAGHHGSASAGTFRFAPQSIDTHFTFRKAERVSVAMQILLLGSGIARVWEAPRVSNLCSGLLAIERKNSNVWHQGLCALNNGILPRWQFKDTASRTSICWETQVQLANLFADPV